MATEYKLSYTATQIDEKLGKIDNLATKNEVPSKTSDLTNDSGFITGYTETDPTVPDWAKKQTKPTYTASEVGADASGTASSLISAHNTATDSHSDIREAINGKLNTSELSNAINTALAQAKESGEFDGADGEDGYTPVKGTDYFTEADKEEFLSDIEAVRYVDQNLTDAQKEQTRKNIAAVGCLIGSSTEIAPSQVRQAILSGENVMISYIDDTFGTFLFSDFTYSEAANCLLCSAIVDYGESLLSATIYGNLEMDAWILSTHEISLKSDIPSAVNEALAQAKANGEFDGKDGTSVTVSKVTESFADGGSNVVTFSDGMTVTIKNGSKGDKGDTGATGPAYTLTTADKSTIVNAVIAALPVYNGEVGN